MRSLSPGRFGRQHRNGSLVTVNVALYGVSVGSFGSARRADALRPKEW